jgi:hypothetical protein
MNSKDILLNDDWDLDIVNGDFNVGFSDNQHLTLIVEIAEGSIKQYPLQGVGINYYSGSSGQAAALQNRIKTKADADRYQNVQVSLEQNQDGAFIYNVYADRT